MGDFTLDTEIIEGRLWIELLILCFWTSATTRRSGFGEREIRFFPFNEILDVDGRNDVQNWDCFEFTVFQDQSTSSIMYSSNNRQSAIKMIWLPSGMVNLNSE